MQSIHIGFRQGQAHSKKDTKQNSKKKKIINREGGGGGLGTISHKIGIDGSNVCYFFPLWLLYDIFSGIAGMSRYMEWHKASVFLYWPRYLYSIQPAVTVRN